MHRPPRKVSSHLEAHLRAIQCAYKLSSRLDCRCVCAAMADDVNCRIVCGEMAADVRLVGGQCGRQRYGSGAHWKWGGEDPSLPDQASPTARPKHSSAGCPLGRSTCREGNARRWGPWSATDTVVPPSQGLGHWGFAGVATTRPQRDCRCIGQLQHRSPWTSSHARVAEGSCSARLLTAFFRPSVTGRPLRISLQSASTK